MRKIRLLTLTAAAALLGATFAASSPAWADHRPGGSGVANFSFFYSYSRDYYPHRHYPHVRGYRRYRHGHYAYNYPRWHRRLRGRALHRGRFDHGHGLHRPRFGRHHFDTPHRASRRFSRRW